MNKFNNFFFNTRPPKKKKPKIVNKNDDGDEEGEEVEKEKETMKKMMMIERSVREIWWVVVEIRKREICHLLSSLPYPCNLPHSQQQRDHGKPLDVGVVGQTDVDHPIVRKKASSSKNIRDAHRLTEDKSIEQQQQQKDPKCWSLRLKP